MVAMVGADIPVLTDWLQIGPVALAVMTVIAAATYYFLVLRQNLTTHQFDVLMRTMAVYHDLMSTKRCIAARFLLERMRDEKRYASAVEQLAVADIVRFFDTVSWRAFTIFKFDLGSCQIGGLCSHGYRRALQQRHEGVRALVREIGLPAYVYYRALTICGQDQGLIVREASLGSVTQFKRMVDAVTGYMPAITRTDPTADLSQARCGGGYYTEFLKREAEAASVRPGAAPAGG